jgi:hypothetical protein
MPAKEFALENIVAIEHNGKVGMEYRGDGRIYNRHEMPVFSIIQQTEQHSNTATQQYNNITALTQQ